MRLASFLLALALTACTGSGSSGTPPDASSTPTAPGAAPTAAPSAPPVNAPTAAAPPTGDTQTVMNPLGKEMQAKKHTAPPAGSIEHTLIQALSHQASNGDFDGFLAWMHPKTKSEPQQLANLKAYQYTSSQGKKAAACLHDGALLTTGRKPVNATVEGGGDVGTKVMVFCGPTRMPVPFTLYPDGDVQRVTVWGLN